MINIKDTLLLPNGNPMANAEVLITTVKSDEVLIGSFIKPATTDSGGLDTQLSNGVFRIEVKPRKYHYVNEYLVEVTDTTPTPITLISLINNHKYVEPEEA